MGVGVHGLQTSLLAAALALGAPVLWLDVPAAAEPGGCTDGFASDFNGDGFTDTVVADPYATVTGNAQAGRVVVLYGDADGRVGEGARGLVSQGAGRVGEAAEAADRFGFAITVSDIDCDGYTDLVVGTPYEDLAGSTDSGLVQIVWGAGGGLGAGPAATHLSQPSFGVSPHTGDLFGYAVDSLVDVGRRGTPDPEGYALAIGAPGFDVSGHNNAGWVGIMHTMGGGSAAVAVTQDTPGVPGTAEVGDRFGAALSVSYLLGEGDTVDVVVGTPNEDIGSAADAGAITVLRDVDDGLDGAVALDQDTTGVPGVVESGDQFGRTLDTIKVGSTSRLAVGVPAEDIGSLANAGSVALFISGTSTVTPSAGLTQDTTGVSDSAEPGDLFGDRVAFIGPGLGDAATRLAVSTPYEDTTAANAGMVQIFPVTDLDTEVTWSQATVGVPGAVEPGDRFGRTLATVSGVSERVVVVGVPNDSGNPTGMVNVLPFGGGAPRFWEPGAAGVPGVGASRFGDAVAGSGS